MSLIDDAVAALQRGLAVIVPTDTVYGLAAAALDEDAVHALYRLKGRAVTQATALMTADVQTLFELVPELDEAQRTIARTLLPGPYTLVLANPAHRYPWLTGGNAGTIGVRVPALPEPTATIVARVRAIAATSANLPEGPDPARLEDVPQELRDGAAMVLDGGDLPGTASTVLDVTGPEPRVLRAGAADADEAIARVEAVLAGK